MKELLDRLKDDGKILIGDVAFETRDELNECKENVGEQWDEDEIYCVADELRTTFPNLSFEKIAFCSGILTLPK